MKLQTKIMQDLSHGIMSIDIEFGNKDGIDEAHYNRWIARKMQIQIDSKERSKTMLFTVDPVDDVVHGHIKGFEKETDIYFYLMPQEV